MPLSACSPTAASHTLRGREVAEADADAAPPGHLYWAGHPSPEGRACVRLIMASATSYSGKLPLVNGSYFTQEMTCPSSGDADWYRGTKRRVSASVWDQLWGAMCVPEPPGGSRHG